MNLWIGVGRLTKDPDMRSYNGGSGSLANFTIAIDRRSKEETDFISCTAFGKTAGVLEKYCHKGMKLIVRGQLQNNNYESKGVKHYSYNILVDSIEFAESKKNDSSGWTGGGDPPPPRTDDSGWVDVTKEPDPDDELPF